MGKLTSRPWTSGVEYRLYEDDDVDDGDDDDGDI